MRKPWEGASTTARATSPCGAAALGGSCTAVSRKRRAGAPVAKILCPLMSQPPSAGSARAAGTPPRETLPSAGSVTTELTRPPSRAIVVQTLANSASDQPSSSTRCSPMRPITFSSMPTATALAVSPWARRSCASTISNRPAPSPP